MAASRPTPWNTVIALLDWFVAPRAAGRAKQDLHQARRVVATTLAIAPIGPAFSLLLWAQGHPEAAAGIGVASALFLVTPLLVRWTGRTGVAGLWATLHYLWVTVFTALCFGGVTAPATMFLAALPLFGAVLGGRRLGGAMLLLAVGSTAGLYASTVLGWVPDPLAASSERALYSFLGAESVILIVYVLAMALRSLSDSALAEVEATNRDLQQVIADERRTRAEVEELNDTLRRQAEQLRKGRMASNILHNVGNALNRVNLLADTVHEDLQSSRARNLGRAVQLLQEHADDIAGFLESDRGATWRAYLVQVAGHLEQERGEWLENMEELQEGLEHLKLAVRMQQGHARGSLLTEFVVLGDVIDQATRFTCWTGRQDFRIEQDVQELPPVLLDRQRLTEIVVNLLSNAKHALHGTEVDEPEIRVEVAEETGGRIRIAVQDNGIGIREEHLEQVFDHGFTTRADGNGFGLHSCRQAAREMGGELTVHSDGPGTGATFVVDLPLDIASRDAPSATPAPSGRLGVARITPLG